MTTGLVQNHFALLGVPEACTIDTALLERNYLALQAKWHPDRFADAAPAERVAALQHASLVNDAYTKLKTPLSRAEYLLQINGVDVHKPGQLDGAFLLEQMELREILEQLRDRRDEAALARLRQHARTEQEALWRDFAAGVETGHFAVARTFFHKLQFLVKLTEEIAAAEDRLLD